MTAAVVDLARLPRDLTVEPPCPVQPCPIPELEAGEGRVLQFPTAPVLDESAVAAERAALLVELVAEQYRTALPHIRVPDRREQLVQWGLESAARQARLVADQHAQRCTRGEGEPCLST